MASKNAKKTKVQENEPEEEMIDDDLDISEDEEGKQAKI